MTPRGVLVGLLNDCRIGDAASPRYGQTAGQGRGTIP
jgi:hypothetical protein